MNTPIAVVFVATVALTMVNSILLWRIAEKVSAYKDRVATSERALKKEMETIADWKARKYADMPIDDGVLSRYSDTGMRIDVRHVVRMILDNLELEIKPPVDLGPTLVPKNAPEKDLSDGA